MADFNPAFEKMLHDEGGMQLTNIPGDRGGMTYAGIARNANPQWAGWNLVDRQEMGGPLTSMVREFYRLNFWDRIRGDEISNQQIAETIRWELEPFLSQQVRNLSIGKILLQNRHIKPEQIQEIVLGTVHGMITSGDIVGEMPGREPMQEEMMPEMMPQEGMPQ
jgi:hypothetical protein